AEFGRERIGLEGIDIADLRADVGEIESDRERISDTVRIGVVGIPERGEIERDRPSDAVVLLVGNVQRREGGLDVAQASTEAPIFRELCRIGERNGVFERVEGGDRVLRAFGGIDELTEVQEYDAGADGAAELLIVVPLEVKVIVEEVV